MNWFNLVLSAMLLQGSLVFFVKLLTNYFNPLNLLLMQYVGSLIALSCYFLVKRLKPLVTRRELLLSFLSGFFVSTGLSFYYLAINLGEVSRVAPLQSVGVTLIPTLLAFIFLKEKINKRVILGIACSILCIILLSI